MARQLRRALRLTRTVELRLDWLRDDRERLLFVGWLGRHHPKATLIGTCRRRLAGGRFPNDIPSEVLFLLLAAFSDCTWCDLEADAVAGVPAGAAAGAPPGARPVVPFPHFAGAPHRL